MRTWAEVLRERLAADTTEAAEYLRATLAEGDAQMLAHAVRTVQEARGSLDGLALREAELLAMVRAPAQFSQAA